MASINDVIQYAIRNLKNAGEIVWKFYEFTLGDPKDVPFEVYDKNGNLIRRTLPNYRKQLRTLLQDKKNLPFFNGGNITTEQELGDFVNNIPERGRGEAKITAPITLTRPLYIGNGKHVSLIIDTDSGGKITFKAFEVNGVKRLPAIQVDSHSYLHIHIRGNPQTPVFDVDLSGVNPATPWNSWSGRRVMFLIVHSEVRMECGGVTSASDKVIAELSNDPQIGFAHIARSRLFINAAWRGSDGKIYNGYIRIADTTTPQEIMKVGSYAEFGLGIRIADSSGNDLFLDTNGNKLAVQWRTFFGGIVYDANPPRVARNVITNNAIIL